MGNLEKLGAKNAGIPVAKRVSKMRFQDKLWHGYPQHTDNSLSRYAWIRASYSWYSTSAVLVVKDKIIAINASLENNEVKINKETERVYISEGIDLKIKRE